MSCLSVCAEAATQSEQDCESVMSVTSQHQAPGWAECYTTAEVLQVAEDAREDEDEIADEDTAIRGGWTRHANAIFSCKC